jgi:hypothetical protein
MSLKLAAAILVLHSAALSAQVPPTRMREVPAPGASGLPARPAPAVDIVAVNVVPTNLLADEPVIAGQTTELECVVYEYHPAGTDPAPLSWKGRVEAEGEVLATFASEAAARAEHVFDGDASMTSWSYGYKASWTPSKPGWSETRCVVDTGNQVAELNEANNAKTSKAWVAGPWSASVGDGPPPTAAMPAPGTAAAPRGTR